MTYFSWQNKLHHQKKKKKNIFSCQYRNKSLKYVIDLFTRNIPLSKKSTAYLGKLKKFTVTVTKSLSQKCPVIQLKTELVLLLVTFVVNPSKVHP